MTIYKQKFVLSPEWSIRQSGKSLLVSGGADAIYEIELSDDKKSFFSSLKIRKSFTKNELPSNDLRVFEELLAAEIVVPLLKASKKLKVATIGDSSKLISYGEDIKVADIVLVVRTKSTYAKLLEKIDYQTLTKPHLFIDIAFHHTLSIGPLVFPGETACIACLQGRISTRWSDTDPPATPRAVKQYYGIASELISTELDRISEGDTSLTNKTVSWDFRNRTVKTDQLLKVPICPICICSQDKYSRSGALVLPWEKDESITNAV